MRKPVYQVTCPICGNVFDESERRCPNCNAVNNLSVCRTCGKLVSARARRCPSCGARHRQRMNTFEKIISAFVLVFALFSLLVIVLSFEDSDKPTQDNNKVNTIQKNSHPEEEFDPNNYVFISAERIKEFGKYMLGERIITSVPASSVGRKVIKSHIAEDDSLTYDLVFNFEDTLEGVQEDNTLIIAGMISGGNSKDAISVDYCRILPDGAYQMKGEPEKQQEYCESIMQSVLDAEAERIAKEKANYIVDCITPTYDDVARNPDNYEGKKVKISGSVIQVAEDFIDLFDTNSVDLRVEAPDGIWYVTYVRPEGESRILEDDYITCYGECDGVTTYISILGSTVTVPKLIMKYHD